jgi:hydroxylamine reductase (hybrid-cluster protein)
MKCKWCGDDFSGGPARIRTHFVRDEDRKSHAALCKSKSEGKVAFTEKVQKAMAETQEKKRLKEMNKELRKQQAIVTSFLKSKSLVEQKGVQLRLQDMNSDACQMATKYDLDMAWRGRWLLAGFHFRFRVFPTRSGGRRCD